MPLFGSVRDIGTMKRISREYMENIISTSIGYYKIVLKDTPVNTYGESSTKTYIGPVLIYCLVQRSDFQFNQTEFGPDNTEDIEFRFLKDHLIEANVVPEVGDVIMYNELYYQIDNVNENQLIMGRDNEYAYRPGYENYGSSYSIILKGHYTSPDSLGININMI